MTEENPEKPREDIVEELHQVERDLMAFSTARNVIQGRINELEGTPRREAFVSWAVTQVILNSFILAVVRCEGLIQDYKKILEDLDVPNNVVQLSFVKGDQDDRTSGD